MPQEATDERASAYVPSFHVASLYDRGGNTAKALEWLDRAYEERHPSMAALAVLPLSEGLKSEPRFRELLQRMNLPDSRPPRAGES
jgi:hypothetical protein